MIPELGQFALALALMLAFFQAACGLGGAAQGNALWMARTRPASQALALLRTHGSIVEIKMEIADGLSFFIANLWTRLLTEY